MTMATETTTNAAESETSWVEKIGKSAYECIAEMVAALECDYERLEELREAKADWEPTPIGMGDPEASNATWAEAEPEDAEELKELEAAAGDCKDRDDAERRIHEDPLSVEVRSGWTTPGEDMTAEDFCILLSTGGPATRIRGELGDDGEPHRAWLEVQDWYKPWTEYYAGSGAAEVLLTYAQCFTYGQ